ncbi:oxidoreductase [Pseudomonas luteola]|uniref:Oxidoreductase n=1 Tax=Pseudomonas luteola TaxID=47886 RepID=A0A2X2D3K7_PSELU|nr:oxidoreductase [Pseudomonas luteola]
MDATTHSSTDPHAHASSYYAATVNRALQFAPIKGEIRADVCVVGGGFSGLNTAIELAERGYSVVLLEAHRIGWGASGRNGGQLIRGVGHDVEQFRPVVGDEGVQAFKQMGFEAVNLVRQRIERYGIECDLTWGYCDLALKPRHLEDFKAELEELHQLGYPHAVQLVARDRIRSVVGSERYLGALIDSGSGHLHPLNLALGEAAAAQSLGCVCMSNLRSLTSSMGRKYAFILREVRCEPKRWSSVATPISRIWNRLSPGRCFRQAATSLQLSHFPKRWPRKSCPIIEPRAISRLLSIIFDSHVIADCCSEAPATIQAVTRKT